MSAATDTILVDELERFAHRLVADYTVSDALHELVDSTVMIFDLAGAGASLARGDRLEFAAATPSVIRTLEEAQEQLQAGPCVEAWHTGKPVLVADTESETRWPGVSEAAAQIDIRAIAALPLRLDGTQLGALDLYSSRAREWSEDDVRTAEVLAAIATGYIANAARLDRVRRTADQLQEALDSRVVIEQAKGVLAGTQGISMDQAFKLLRSHSRSHNASLHEVAHAVVSLGLRPDCRSTRGSGS